jgi:hypothetical protein
MFILNVFELNNTWVYIQLYTSQGESPDNYINDGPLYFLALRYLLYMRISGRQILLGVILRSLTPPNSDSFHLRL